MVYPRWRMVPDPSLAMNNVVMTSPLQIVTACLLQNAASGITMCDNFISTKVRLNSCHNIVVT